MNVMYPALPVWRGRGKESTDAMTRRVQKAMDGMFTAFGGAPLPVAAAAVIAVLTLCQTVEAADFEMVPTIDWSMADSSGSNAAAGQVLSVVTAVSEPPVALDDTIGSLIDESLPRPVAEDPTESFETTQVASPAGARPVLIPVRPALSIGGVMLALLAPTLRHCRRRRVFR